MANSSPRKSTDSSPSPLFSPHTRDGEYPFPRYDSFQRPGSSSSRYQPRRGSTASSVHSIGGSLDTSTSNWTHSVQEASQNAISTLLQPPIVRTGLQPHTSAPSSSTHKAPTTRDIPPVTLTNINHVETSVFKAYLTQVGSLYDALQRAKEQDADESPRLSRKGSKYDDLGDLLELDSGRRSSRQPILSRQGSLASLTSITPLESPKPKRRFSGQRRVPQGPTPLTTIPIVYFDDDFHLENPRTFDVVSERSEVVRPTPGSPERKGSNGTVATPRKALATNAILQEKLSWYMDTIEIHLINSISSASTSFFAALGSLRELHQEASESVGRIRTLRDELNSLDEEMAIGGLDIITQRRKRENLKQLSEAIEQLRCIVSGVGQCETLVEAGEIETALDAIDALERLIMGEQSYSDAEILDLEMRINLRDLRDATALQGVTTDMDILRHRVGRTYESRFLGALLGDIRQHISNAQVEHTLHRWSNASNRTRGGNREPSAPPSYLNIKDDFRRDLKKNLNGLHRAQHITPAATAYREAVLREIKSIIKKPLPSSNDDDNDSMMSVSTTAGKQLSSQDKSAILARNLRALDPATAEEMLVSVYLGVGESLRRLGAQVKVLLDVTSTLGEPKSSNGALSPRTLSPPRSPGMGTIDGRLSNANSEEESTVRQIQEEMHQALDVSNLIGQAVDVAQNQIVKVLRVRSEQSVHQTPTRFLRYFTLNLLFANECEALSGRGGVALKTVVNNQIKDFIKQLGESEQQNLAQGMDADQWNAKDFLEADNIVLDRVLEGSDRDPDAWSAGSKVWLPYSEFQNTASAGAPAVAANGTTREKTKPAIIEGDSYILPHSAILCLHGLQPFLELITGIPSVSTDIASSIVSYLQLFNSRCTQLILGAGATKSVGLKNITTKHLALASQALSFIATLIPHIREFVRRHVGAGPAVSTVMGEFDKVRRLYQEHQNSISDKLVDIMSGRAATHVKSMKLIMWDEKPPTAVSPYMETLVKETSTLHKVLSRHLPDTTVDMIMDPVFKSYKEQWSNAYGAVAPDTEAGKNSMLRDVEFFNTKLSKLNGSSDTGSSLVQLVKDKKISRPVAVIPAEAPLPPAPVPLEEVKQEFKEEAKGTVAMAVDTEIPPTPPVEDADGTTDDR